MAFQHIEVKKIAGALGAEVFGVDLSRPLTNAEADEVNQAYLENLVVFFPGQNLSPEALVKVADLFGVPNEYPFAKGMEGHPKITPLIKNPEDKANFGGGAFHAVPADPDEKAGSGPAASAEGADDPPRPPFRPGL